MKKKYEVVKIYKKILFVTDGSPHSDNAAKQIVEFQKEFKNKREKGFTDKNEEQEYKEKFEGMKEKAESAEKELNKISENLGGDDTPKRKLFNRVTDDNKTKVEQIKLPDNGTEGKTKFLTDELSALNRKEKKFLSKIFGVIDRVLPKELAENLKEKIKIKDDILTILICKLSLC